MAIWNYSNRNQGRFRDYLDGGTGTAPITKIQVRRGDTNPTMDDGEPFWNTDERVLYMAGYRISGVTDQVAVTQGDRPDYLLDKLEAGNGISFSIGGSSSDQKIVVATTGNQLDVLGNAEFTELVAFGADPQSQLTGASIYYAAPGELTHVVRLTGVPDEDVSGADAWVISTAYVQNDVVAVTNALGDTIRYTCILDHTADILMNRPGYGADWTDYWRMDSEAIVLASEMSFSIGALFNRTMLRNVHGFTFRDVTGSYRASVRASGLAGDWDAYLPTVSASAAGACLYVSEIDADGVMVLEWMTPSIEDVTLGNPVPIEYGGTGQATAGEAINALLPDQTGNTGYVLTTDGTDVSWTAITGGGSGDMTLNTNQTVTGVKTFGAAGNVGKLAIAGTTSGSTVLDATAVASGTLTLPAATDTLVGRATTDTLTNKTLTTPTIASFVNATHTHANAAGGGTLDAAAIATGTIATARLGSGTANSSTFLRGDNTWATPAGAGTVTSVALAGGDGVSVSGSPITGAGTITVSLGNITPDNVDASGRAAFYDASITTNKTLTAEETFSHTSGNRWGGDFLAQLNAAAGSGSVTGLRGQAVAIGTTGAQNGSLYGVYGYSLAGDSDNVANLYGVLGKAETQNGVASAEAVGAYGLVDHGSATACGDVYGGKFFVTADGAGQVTGAHGVYGTVDVKSTGDVLLAYGLRAAITKDVGGALTTAVGLKVDSITAGTTNWSMQVGSAQSYHVGNLRIGSTTAPTVPLDVTGAIKSSSSIQGLSLKLQETGGGTDTITLQAPASLAANYTLTMPADDGTSGQVLTTDGSGTLSWTTSASSGSVTSVSVATANGVSGVVANATTTPEITLTLGAITPTSIDCSGSAAIGFGVAPVSDKILQVGSSFAASPYDQYGGHFSAVWANAATSYGALRGLFSQAWNGGSADIGAMYGVHGYALKQQTHACDDLYGGFFDSDLSAGTSTTVAGGVYARAAVTSTAGGTLAPEAYGVYALTKHSGSGTVTTGVGVYGLVDLTSAGATVTTAYGVRAAVTKTLGTITTAVGLRVESITAGTNNWAIQSAGGRSYHVGRIRLGSAADCTMPQQISWTGSVPNGSMELDGALWAKGRAAFGSGTNVDPSRYYSLRVGEIITSNGGTTYGTSSVLQQALSSSSANDLVGIYGAVIQNSGTIANPGGNVAMSGYAEARYAAAAAIVGGKFQALSYGSAGRATGYQAGLEVSASAEGSYAGTLTPVLYGATIAANNDGTHSASVVTAHYGLQVSCDIGASTAESTTLYGLDLAVSNTGGGASTTAAGLHIQAMPGTLGGTEYAIAAEGGESYHVGGMQLGDASLPETKAILELTSTTRGFLPPRMTTAQRDAISSPPEGLVVYNTTTKAMNFYNGTTWAAF